MNRPVTIRLTVAEAEFLAWQMAETRQRRQAFILNASREGKGETPEVSQRQIEYGYCDTILAELGYSSTEYLLNSHGGL